MRLFVNMVIKNEADRYLDACLSWIAPHVDGVFIYDDRSEDVSVELASSHGALVAVRGEKEPSFLEAEDSFRQAGWMHLISAFGIKHGDWVLGLDADEFPFPPDQFKRFASKSSSANYSSINIYIPEVFGLDPVEIRQDGFWGKITGTRLARFTGGSQEFRQYGMGCGVFPSYAYYCKNLNENKNLLRIIHFGYADPKDRLSKFERYTSLNKNGHADSHIQSILKPGKLALLDKEIDIWRGIKS